jgi:hypothetical protein
MTGVHTSHRRPPHVTHTRVAVGRYAAALQLTAKVTWKCSQPAVRPGQAPHNRPQDDCSLCSIGCNNCNIYNWLQRSCCLRYLKLASRTGAPACCSRHPPPAPSHKHAAQTAHLVNHWMVNHWMVNHWMVTRVDSYQPRALCPDGRAAVLCCTVVAPTGLCVSQQPGVPLTAPLLAQGTGHC